MQTSDFKTLSHVMEAAGLVTLELEPIYLFILVGTIQLALRHPEYRGQSADLAREAAIAFQQRLGEIDPAIAAALEQGWHPEFDVTSEEFDQMEAENAWDDSMSDRPSDGDAIDD